MAECVHVDSDPLAIGVLLSDQGHHGAVIHRLVRLLKLRLPLFASDLFLFSSEFLSNVVDIFLTTYKKVILQISERYLL